MARGPQAVREALIDAAADLFASDGDVSVRAIAARAGVNHGLVHHYFDGKDGLRRAVLEHLAAAQAQRMADADADATDLLALARSALAAANEDARFWRILARALLDGQIPEPFQHAYPVVRSLVDGMQRAGVPQAKLRVAQGLAVAFGWTLFEPWIRAATDMPVAQAERLVEDALETGLSSVMEPA